MSHEHADVDEYEDIDDEIDVEEEDTNEVSQQDKWNDFTIVSQLSRIFDDLLSVPDIDVPSNEVSMRASSSGLPDGSLFMEDFVAPIGETLDKFFLRLSTEAAKAWQSWLNPDEQNISMNGIIQKLNGNFIELMLGDDIKYYEEIKRLKQIEDNLYQEQEDERVKRRYQLYNIENNHQVHDKDIKNRYYVVEEITRGEFGQINKKVTTIDRCQGKPDIKVIEGVSSSLVERTTYTLSRKENLEKYNLTKHETEVWRKPAKDEKDNYIPNAFSPQDDLDFIPPSSLSSRNFNIYPPASRPYNCVFKVRWDRNPDYVMPTNGDIDYSKMYTKMKKVFPIVGKKDYMSLSSIQYMLETKGFKDVLVTIDEYVAKGKKYPNCKFEIDLRVTYGEDLIPDPNSYKKVDPDSNLGMKLLQLLNEQPYLWKEFYWDIVDDSGFKQKVGAVGYLVNKSTDELAPKRVYWVLLNRDSNAIGKPAFLRKRTIPPQYIYKTYTLKDVDTKIPFTATVRVSDGFFFYDKEGNSVSFNNVVSTFKNIMFEKGYLFVKQEQETPYTNIQLFHFIHKEMHTKEQRKSVFLSLTSQRESHV